MGEGGVALTAEDRARELVQLIGDRATVLHGPGGDSALSGRDIDCLVDGIDLMWTLRLPEGWRLCNWTRYDLRAWYWVVEHTGQLVGIDTTDDPDGFCRDALRTRSFQAQWSDDGSPLLHAAYLTVKRVRKGQLDPAQWAAIGLVASEDAVGFASALELVAGPGLATLLTPSAVAGRVPPPSKVRRANRLRRIRRFGSPERIGRALSLGVRRYIERIGCPSGLSVLIVGPDGAGKSTLAEVLPSAVQPMFRRHVRSHWRPGILPRPGALLGRAADDPTQPHARVPYGHGLTTVMLAYYWLDFFVGAALGDLPTKIRTGLIVRERGWWDLAVDPARYRLRVSARLVRALGALLPRPDLVIVLGARADLLYMRKQELGRDELERQLAAWRSAMPPTVPTVHIDVDRPAAEVALRAADAIATVMELRALSRLGAGWVALPTGPIRWWLPRGHRSAARTSVSIYQPVSPRALAGWRLARAVATAGGFRLLPRGPAPPRVVRQALGPHIPPRGTIAVARATQVGRFVALILDDAGACCGVAKLATGEQGVHALEQEAASLDLYAATLPATLRMPRVLHAEPGLLVLEPIEWTPRRTPWILEEEVAGALGQFFLTGKREDGDGPVGPAHGDCAPWNLLRTTWGWALVDWESARAAPAFHDVCHHVVQSHALLGRPSATAVVDGFTLGEGWIGRAVRAYAEAAGLPPDSAPGSLVRYLRDAIRDRTAGTANERRGVARREQLLARLGRC